MLNLTSLLRPLLTVSTTLLAATALVALAPAAASASASSPAASFRPGQVVVTYDAGVTATARASAQRSTHTGTPKAFAPRSRTLNIHDGRSVGETVRALRATPGVASANPVYLAKASGFVPNDPGEVGQPGGWAQTQWNLLPGTGVNAPDAWDTLIARKRPGGAGVTIAVLDTGVAYANRGRFRRSPDLSSTRLRKGYDFVSGDPYPNDQNGHGTHVASTIGESADNGVGLVGLAYGAQIMPLRVLDSRGTGDAPDIARGIRYAVRNGAQIINLSFEFDEAVTGAGIPEVLAALRYAQDKNVLVVGASGNARSGSVAYPARSSMVESVGAVTEHGCLAEYSNRGSHLDISAPGGGADAFIPGDPRCRPTEPPGRDIFQMTLDGSVRRFGLPGGYFGTSMAAPHVSATAALVIASGVLGPRPSVRALRARLRATATDLGVPGPDSRYGAGMVDAARAVSPTG